MITTIMIIVFILGYMAIALEHPIKIDKAASALIIGGLGWALYAFSGVDAGHMNEHLSHHLVDIAEILFFLLGAMTIVELIDAHEGFSIITNKIIVNNSITSLYHIHLDILQYRFPSKLSQLELQQF